MPASDWFLPAPDKARLIDSVGTKRLSIAGTSGAGKTYAVMRLCELLYERQSPFVVLDTVGNFWGLRVAKDGKSPGLSIPVLGGMHGDLELEVEAGPLVADFLQKTRTSLVVDLSMMDEEARASFVASFAKRLLSLWKQKRQVLTVIVDEAQDIVPELLAVRGDKVMRSAMHTLGLQGRNFGIGLCLVTQAPQNVLKRLFNLADLLIAGRLGGEHERGAVVRWVKQKGIGKDALDDLSTLPTGTLYAWSPSWLEFFGKVRTTERWTFDSSKTPELGDVALDEGARAPVDLERLGAALRALTPVKEQPSAELDAEGAVELVLRLKALEKENGQLLQNMRETEQESSELGHRLQRAEVLLVQGRDALETAARAFGAALEALGSGLAGAPPAPPAKLQTALVRLVETARRAVPAAVVEAASEVGPAPRAAKRPPKAPGGRRARSGEDASSRLDKAGSAILSVLSQYTEPIPRARLALLAGYSPRGGGFNNCLSRLRVRGWLEGSGLVSITVAGRKVAAPVSLMPQGADLIRYWRDHRRMDAPMRSIFLTLVMSPGPLTKEAIGKKTGYSHTAGSFNNALSRLRVLGLIEGKGKEPLRLVAVLAEAAREAA